MVPEYMLPSLSPSQPVMPDGERYFPDRSLYTCRLFIFVSLFLLLFAFLVYSSLFSEECVYKATTYYINNN